MQLIEPPGVVRNDVSSSAVRVVMDHELVGIMGNAVSARAAAVKASRRMSCSLYACAMAPAGVSLTEPRDAAEADPDERFPSTLCSTVERWLRDGAPEGETIDRSGYDIDDVRRGGVAADVVALTRPDADFFLKRLLGRCCGDGGGDWAGDRSEGSGIGTIGEPVHRLT
jgi:hypothetical protein